MSKTSPATLGSLASVAARLNAASDSLSFTLRSIESGLNALGLGIERFVPVPDTRVWDDDALDPLNPDTEDWTEEQLGYVRLGDAWGLVTRSARFVRDQSEEEWTFGEEKALLRASRADRIRAAAALPQLIEEMKAEAEKLIAVVEVARGLAEVPAHDSGLNDDVDPRYAAFLRSTTEADRSKQAFIEFENFVDTVARSAAMMNPFDSEPGTDEESRLLRMAVSGMLYRVLPKVGLETIYGSGEGIGSAILYGLLAPKADALDHIDDVAAFEELAARGWDAEHAYTESRVRELEAKAESEG